MDEGTRQFMLGAGVMFLVLYAVAVSTPADHGDGHATVRGSDFLIGLAAAGLAVGAAYWAGMHAR